jgi:hypothetical protein
MNWMKRLTAIRARVAAEIHAYLNANAEPEPCYLMYFPTRPSNEVEGKILWGDLGFARGLESLKTYQNEGWQLADPRGIRKELGSAEILDFVFSSTRHVPILGSC